MGQYRGFSAFLTLDTLKLSNLTLPEYNNMVLNQTKRNNFLCPIKQYS